MKVSIHLLTVCAGVLMMVDCYGQQAWMRPKNSFYVQAGGSFLQASSLLNGTEDLIPLNRDVTDVTLQAYGEYGVTDRLMVTVQVPVKLLSVQNTIGRPSVADGSLVALSNIQAALSGSIYNKHGWVVSAKAGVSLPTSRFDAGTGLRSGFDALSLSPSLMVGLGRNKFFSSAEVGYVYRTNGYSNRIFGAWQIGTTVGKKKRLLPILGFEFMKSGDNGTFDDGSSITTGLYLDKQSFLSPNLKLGYKATANTMIWLSVGGGVGDVTRNVAASPGLSLSVSYQH
jgi:hypothetical protein